MVSATAAWGRRCNAVSKIVSAFARRRHCEGVRARDCEGDLRGAAREVGRSIRARIGGLTAMFALASTRQFLVAASVGDSTWHECPGEGDVDGGADVTPRLSTVAALSDGLVNASTRFRYYDGRVRGIMTNRSWGMVVSVLAVQPEWRTSLRRAFVTARNFEAALDRETSDVC